ncbi:hypothetical protein CEXT_568581 [Caerostris extrusa]|uniref:Uncharacterized protein n=1 Tax=Caerostris extrusa TaxID=172846 RepID=A0AAV4YBA1_CAEEX|nr:hypothetical protein CEXT_568581 [Caerostris extrusa]
MGNKNGKREKESICPPPRKRIKDNCCGQVSREDNRSHRKERTLFAKGFFRLFAFRICATARGDISKDFLPSPPPIIGGGGWVGEVGAVAILPYRASQR